MSYQVLARKWRPATFTDVVGQQHVLTALANGLSLGRIHHAYLFSGTRGVGKTSIARLLAKGLNCEKGVTASPCGVCDSCQQISQGRFVDLIEIDAASRTKVEDTRELLDNVQYAPVRGRYKIYLIDEVHMLSRHSFNALLKTLEEPPEHVKFLLATTDPQKLPVTILSRCLQFHLKALDSAQIRGQLERILSEENTPFEPRALQMLARAADGSLRDALSLTDQAIASGGGQLTSDAVSNMLGTLDDGQALLLIDALSRTDGEQVMAHIQSAASRGVEWDTLLIEMLQLLHGVAMAQLLPPVAGSVPDEAEQRQRELAHRLSPEDVQLYYQILLIGRKELPLAPDQRMGVEMTLLRALAFQPKTIRGQPAVSGRLPVVAMPAESSVASPISTVTMELHAGAQLQSVMSPQVKTTPSPQTVTPPDITSTSVQPDTSAVQTDVVLPQITSSVLQARQQVQRLRQLSENRQATSAASVSSQHSKTTTGLAMPADSALSLIRKASPQLTPSLQQVPQSALSQPLQTESAQTPETAPQRLLQPSSTQPSSTQPSSTQPSSTQPSSTQPSSTQPSSTQEQVRQPVADTAAALSASQQDYRWQAQTSTEDDSTTVTRPAALRSIMEHEKTPELTAKIAAEVTERDPWARQISVLQIPKLVEQLALNSYKQQNGKHITLHMRSACRHLNTPAAQQALRQALSENSNDEIELTITEDDNPQQLTPQEWRNVIYAEKLAQARQAIMADSHIQTLCQLFEAELDDSSIRPI